MVQFSSVEAPARPIRLPALTSGVFPAPSAIFTLTRLVTFVTVADAEDEASTPKVTASAGMVAFPSNVTFFTIPLRVANIGTSVLMPEIL